MYKEKDLIINRFVNLKNSEMLSHINIKLFTLLCLLILSLNSSAQYPEIAEAEYLIDGGSPTAMNAGDGAFDDLWEEIQTQVAALPQGLHTISIRTKDASNNWSPYFNTVLSVESPLTARNSLINLAQYRIDGASYTNAIVVDGNYNEAFESIMNTGIVSPGVGLHTLEIRFRDVAGVWSNVFKSVFSVEEPLTARNSSITLAEYWLDSDSPQAMIVFDGNWDEAFENSSLNSLPAGGQGLHTLHIRTVGLDGTWSNTFRTVLSVENPITSRQSFVTEAEYWFNSDSAQPLIIFDGDWDEAYEAAYESNLPALTAGLHTLSVRVKGLDGTWSNTFTTVISSEEAITARNTNITQAEIWVDAEAAQPMLVFDGDWNEAFEAVFKNSLVANTPGLHTISLRMQGLDGTWSNTIRSVVTVEEAITARLTRIIEAEIYFDNNTAVTYPLIAFDGGLDEVVESALGEINSAILVTEGLHTIHFRVKGLDGAWGNDFKTVIYLDPCLTSPTVNITPNGNLDLCPGDSLLLTATAGMEQYLWYRNAVEVGDQETLWATEPGYYYVVGYDVEGCPGASEGVWIDPVATPALTLTASGSTSFCEGGSVTFTASGTFVSYEWHDASTGNTFNTSVDAQVHVAAETIEGCTVYSDTIPVVVYSAPTAPIISYVDDLIICQNDSVQLTSDISSGILWSTGSTDQSIWATIGGDYAVTYTDTELCSAQSDIVSITQSQVVAQITPVSDVDICDGQTQNIIALDGPGFMFQWLESGNDILTENGQSYSATTAGIYSVLVSDNLGCADTSETVTVSVLPTPDATITADGSTAFCVGGTVNLSVTEGTEWLWNTGATTSSIEATEAGNYQVLVEAANGCQSLSEFFSVDVTSPLAGFNADPPIVWFPDTDVDFTATVVGNIVSYDWDFGDGQTSTAISPTNTYAAPGFYDVSLTVEDDNGCIGSLTGTQLVEVWEIFENDSLGTGEDITVTAQAFINTLIGCITLSDGSVLATDDGGLTWTDVTGSLNSPFLNDILLTGDANNNIAIVVGPNGTTGVSINGGPWVTPATGTSENLTNIIEGPPGIYYATGDNGTALCYQNGTWTNISYPGGSGIGFGAPYWWNGVLWVVGSNGGLYGWNGGGWSSYGGGFGGGGGGGSGGGLGFGSGGGGGGIGVYGSGSGGGIWTSSNGGGIWTQTWPGNGYGINTVTVVNENLIICAGDHGMVLISEDGGNTWEIFSTGNTEDITDVETEGCQGYFTGALGGFYVFLIPGYQALPPEISISPSQSYCGSDPVYLTVIAPRPGNTYIWNTGFVGSQLLITESGDYYVTMEEFCDTVSTAPITMTINEPLSWHPDVDEDGFGDVYTEVLSCEQPGPGYTLDDRDCFDNDPIFVLCCPGDINNDGIVNTGDLTLLLSGFGVNCGVPFCGGDINGDSIVNTADMVALLSVFGGTCD